VRVDPVVEQTEKGERKSCSLHTYTYPYAHYVSICVCVCASAHTHMCMYIYLSIHTCDSRHGTEPGINSATH